MRERVITFGDDRGLVGVLTEAADLGAGEERPGFVVLNSGILHRVGANRLHVKMTRKAAALGFPALRFDHSGIGDSAPRRDATPFRETAVAEAREAMDLLQRTRGVERFILGGLCSGSDAAYWTALADERVVGLVQLDPFLYRTRGFYVRHYLPRLLSPRKWWRSLRSRGAQLISSIRERGNPVGPQDEFADPRWTGPQYTRIFPPRDQVGEGLGELAGRGVRFHVYVSGTMIDYLNHPDQYAAAFPQADFGDRLEVIHRPSADHTVSDIDEQARLLLGLERWLEAGWGTS